MCSTASENDHARKVAQIKGCALGNNHYISIMCTEVYRLFLLSHCPFSLIYYAFGV